LAAPRENNWRAATSRGDRTVIAGLWLGGAPGLDASVQISTAPMFALALLWLLLLGPDKIIINPRMELEQGGRGNAAGVVRALGGHISFTSPTCCPRRNSDCNFPQLDRTHREGRFEDTSTTACSFPLENMLRASRTGQAQPARPGRIFSGAGIQSGRWKMYYPTAILLKMANVVLFLALAGLMLALVRKIRVPVDLWIMSSFPQFTSPWQSLPASTFGDRHVLPLYPFALLFAAVVWIGPDRYAQDENAPRPRFWHCSSF